ncbi:MAG: efflux RND transporter periplasmic adaptor subunit [bacterium]
MHKYSINSAVILCACFLFSGCAGKNVGSLKLSGTIEAESVRAGSRIGGRIADVMVDEGQTVNSGDTLFMLETDVINAERERVLAGVGETQAAYDVIKAGAKPEDIARAKQESEALRQTYELALAGPLPEDIAAAENQAGSLAAVYRNAVDAYGRMGKLFKNGAVSERELVASKEAAAAANSQWGAALKQVEALKKRPRDQEIEAARARWQASVDAVNSLESGATKEQLDSAEAHIKTAMEGLNRIDVDLAECTVKAPMNGLISKFDLKPGDFIAPGAASCEIIDMAQLKVIVYISMDKLGFIREGADVQIKVDSFPDKIFDGKIKRIAAEAEFTPRNVQTVDERIMQLFAVECDINNDEKLLRPGMAADVTIKIE